MKRVLSVLGAVAALVMAAPAGAQQLKVGFINSQRVLAEAPEVAAAQQTLERELPGFRAQVDSLERALQQGQENFQRQQATLSEQVRQQRQTELQQQFQAYQQRVAQLEQTVQRRQGELVAPAMRRINDTVEAVRREGSFSFIVDASNGGIVAVDPALDITDRVIQRLRGGAAAPAPRP